MNEIIYVNPTQTVYVAPAWQGWGVWQQSQSGFWDGLHRFNGDKLTEVGFVFSTPERAVEFAKMAVNP